MNKRHTETFPEEQPSFWMSYADIMAGLLFVFILILLYTVYDYRSELQQKQSEIDRMLGIRTEIVQALKKEFEDLDIDEQTGAIRFPGGIFFAFDSYRLTDQGKDYLQQFIPKYVQILLGPEFRDYIAQIIIEGHTDDEGAY